ncbi:MAG: FecR domain-containing protein [Alphaproteobacteria bacterium]|nr:FecR domain-containing protein [Alphaproteobacteria bacterium]
MQLSPPRCCLPPDGSALTPQLVNSFIAEPLQYADASGGAGAHDESPVGAVQEVTGEATVTRMDGTVETIQIGTPIYQGDVVETDSSGAVNIVFIDETSFAVSEDARLAIDEYVYDPSTQSGTTNFSVLKGVFVFTSGMIGREDPDDVHIDTPVGSIGIRGTIIAGNVDKGEITVVEGAIVLKDFSGNEMTLAMQFETARFNSGTNQIEHIGQMAANQVVQNFMSITPVSPQLFSSINDSARENGNGNDAPKAGGNQQQGAEENGQPNQNDGNEQNQGTEQSGEQQGNTGEQAAPVQNGAGQQQPQQQQQGQQQTQPQQGSGLGNQGLGGDGSGLQSGNKGPAAAGTQPNGTTGTGAQTGGAAGGTQQPPTQTAPKPPAQQTTQTNTNEPPPPEVIQNQSTTPPPNTPPSILGFSGPKSLMENITAPTVVARVDATGNNPGETLTYKLLNGNTHFTIGPDGVIRSRAGVSFDFEAVPNINLQVEVSDGRDRIVKTVTINITNDPADDFVNTAPTATNATLTATEDTPRSFSAGDFGFSDVDSGSGDAMTAVRIDSLPASGLLKLSGVTVSPGQVITVADLANLTFTPAADANGASYANFNFSVRDSHGAWSAASGNTITFNVTAINDAPTITANTGFTVAEGNTIAITPAMLGSADVDDTTVGRTYTVTSGPSNGHLAFSGAPGAAITTFTQADIDAGIVIFVHDGSETLSDSFDISLTDGGEDGAAAVNATISVNVTPDSSYDGDASNETFFAMNGDGIDTFDGAGGNDTYDAIGLSGPIRAELGASKVYFNGDTEIDFLTNVEEIIGTGGADIFVAANGADGFDVIDGGTGIDVYDASSVTSSININLTTNEVKIISDTNKIYDFETFNLGIGDDTVYTDTFAFKMHINTGDGNDVIYGSDLGNDIVIDGGNGWDTIDVSGLTNSITFDVANGIIDDGSGYTYQLSNIEQVDAAGGTLDLGGFGTGADLDFSNNKVNNNGSSFSGFDQFIGSGYNDIIRVSNTDLSDSSYFFDGTGGMDTIRFDDMGGSYNFVVDTDNIQSIEIFDFMSNGSVDAIDFAVNAELFNGLDSGNMIDIKIDDTDTIKLDFTAYENSGHFTAGTTWHDGTYWVHEYNSTSGDVVRVKSDSSDRSNIHTMGVVQLDLNALSGMTDFGHIIAGNSGMNFGETIASLGDTDGDGFDDLLIGRGNDDTLALFQTPVSANYFNEADLLREAFQGYIGEGGIHSIASIGDFNGDGKADFIVGLPDFNDSTNYGAAVIMDQDGTIIHVMHGTSLGDRFGEDVIGLGDVNGDGFDDVMISAPNAGSSTIVYGGDSIHNTAGTPGGNIDIVGLSNGSVFVLQDGTLQKFSVDGSGMISAATDMSFSMSGTPMAVHATTTYGAIVGNDGATGTVIIFDSSSGTPSIVGTPINVAGLMNAVDVFVVSSTRALVMLDDGQIRIVDNINSSPTLQPSPLENFPAMGNPGEFLGISGSYLYVLRDDGSIKKINFGNSLSVLTDGVLTTGVLDAATIPTSGLQDIVLRPGVPPTLMALYDMGGHTEIRELNENGSQTGVVYSSQPGVPGGSIHMPSIAGATELDFSNTRLAVKTDDGTITRLNISDPSAPIMDGVFRSDSFDDTASPGHDVIFVGTGNQMIVMNDGSISTIGNDYGATDTMTVPPDGTIASIGDFDGDGLTDLIVADPNGDGLNMGTVTIHYGGSINIGGYETVIHGIAVDGSDNEIPVIKLGDINGDGQADFAIAASGENSNRGYIHVVYGDASVKGNGMTAGSLDVNTFTGANYDKGFTIQTNSDTYAASIFGGGAVGDFNGDGIDDFAIAFKREYDGVEHRDVDIFILYGSDNLDPDSPLYDGLVTMDELQNNDNAFHMIYQIDPGVASPDNFDLEITRAGDVNGDGLYDLAIGTPQDNGNNGEVMIVYGQTTSDLDIIQISDLDLYINDTVNASASDQTLMGGLGNDILDQWNTAYSDLVMLGGGGDDRFIVRNQTFNSIDGGSGQNDVIEFQSGIVDLTSFSGHEMSRIEQMVMDSSGQIMTIKLSTIMEMLNSSDTGNLIIKSNGGGNYLEIDTDQSMTNVADGGGDETAASVTLALEDVFGDGNVHHETRTDGGTTYEDFTIGGHTISIDSNLINTIVVSDVP